jgi:hypothetical protein
VASQRQVNVRLDEETIELLEVAGFLDGRNLLDEVRAAIHARAEEAAKDPEVQEVLARRRNRKPAKSEPAVVSSLDEKRKRSERSR